MRTAEEIEREGAQIDALRNGLHETRVLCSDMGAQIDRFEDRVATLDPLVLPMHRALSVIARVSANVEETLGVARVLAEKHDVARHEEALLQSGPTPENIASYIDAVERLRREAHDMRAAGLEYCRVTLARLDAGRALGLQAMLQKHREWLDDAAPETDVDALLAYAKDPAGHEAARAIAPDTAAVLQRIAAHAAAVPDAPLGERPLATLLALYAEARGGALMRGLGGAFAAATDAGAASAGPAQYERGTHALVRAARLFFAASAAECAVASSAFGAVSFDASDAPTTPLKSPTGGSLASSAAVQRALRHPAAALGVSSEAAAGRVRTSLARCGRRGDDQYVDLFWVLDVVEVLGDLYHGCADDPFRDTIGDGIGDGTGGRIGDGTGGRIGDGTGGRIGDGTGNAIGDGIGETIGDGIGDAIGDGTGDAIGDGIDNGPTDSHNGGDTEFTDTAARNVAAALRRDVGEATRRMAEPAVRTATGAAVALVRAMLGEVGGRLDAGGAPAPGLQSAPQSAPGTQTDADVDPPPESSTVAEYTSELLVCLRRLLEYGRVLEGVLGAWADAGPSGEVAAVGALPAPEAAGPALDDTGRAIDDGQSTDDQSAPLFAASMYFQDILRGIERTVARQLGFFRRPAPAALFELNNANHVLRTLRTAPGIGAMLPAGAREPRHAQRVDTLCARYVAHWEKVAALLAPGTGGRAAGMSPRDRLRAWTGEFEDLHREQARLAVPDPELKARLIAAVREAVLAPFEAFYNANQPLFQAGALQSRNRYDPSYVDRQLSASVLFSA